MFFVDFKKCVLYYYCVVPKKRFLKALRYILIGIAIFLLLQVSYSSYTYFYGSYRCGGFAGETCPENFVCVNPLIEKGNVADVQGRCVATSLSAFQTRKEWSSSMSISEKIDYQDSKRTGVLNLFDQNLSVFPDEILELTNLRVLNLGNNRLESLPSQLAQLKNLEILTLDNNEFTEFPDVVTRLSNLVSLDLSNNRIKTIIPDVANLKNLERLNLSRNRLEKLPTEIVDLRKVKELNVSYNNLTSLPQEYNQSHPFVAKICPNPYNLEDMPIKFLFRTVELSFFYEKNGNIYEETAEKGEGITHLARRVVNNFLSYAEDSGLMEIITSRKTNLCLEDYLQNKTGNELLKVGEKRVFTADLLEKAVLSCGLIKNVCTTNAYFYKNRGY